jgi:hypothetical protein
MDSPDFGGLLCSSTAISADLWRLGQVKPGGFLRLKPTTFEHALELVDRVEDFITDVQALVGRKSEKIRTLDVTLPPSGILEGTSNGIIKKYLRMGTSFRLCIDGVEVVSFWSKLESRHAM